MLFAHVPFQPAAEVPCSLALVGDAPRDTAVCRGQPICGPEGKILKQALRLAGIEHEACWIGNVFDEQMPDNSIKGWCQREREEWNEPYLGPLIRYPGAGFLQRAYYWHFDRLAAELRAAQPAVIVPLGGVALWAFSGTTAIGEARGAVSRATQLVYGAKLLPTFHPAYILRQYKMLGTLVGDLKKAIAEARRPADTLRLTPRELWVEPSVPDIIEFIERYLLKSELITIDIETALGQISEIGFGADAHHGITIKFIDYRKPNRCFFDTLGEELAAWAHVCRICELPQPKLFQNGPFDTWHLIRRGVRVVNWREDTRLLHHALYPELPKTLAYMGAAYAHEGPWKLFSEHRRKDQEKRDS